jgi:general secretion pathway protein M
MSILAANRSMVVVLLSLLPAVLLYAWLLSFVFMKRADYVNVTETLSPRIARVQGIAQSEDLLRARAASLEARLAELVYPFSEDRASTAAALQQSLRAELQQAGLEVSGSQIMSPRVSDDFDHIVVSVNAAGDTLALARALDALAVLRPMVLVQDLDVQAQRSRRGQPDGQIAVRMQLLTLRLLR